MPSILSSCRCPQGSWALVLSLVLALVFPGCGARAPAPARAALLPVSRAGGDVLGTNIAGLLPQRRLGGDGSGAAAAGAAAPRATLVRFWTNTCPFCARSLPALEQLRAQYGSRGLATLAVYHPKPPRDVPAAQVQRDAERLGYRGDLAVDPNWESLRRIWLDTGRRSATSVSFLLDAAGVVRFVHPGPEFHPSSDPEHAQCDRDFADLEAAIRFLLDEGAP